MRGMGCYLEDYRASVGAWAARTAWRTAVGKVEKGRNKHFDGTYDCECSGNSNLINNRRSGAKSGPR